MRFSRLLASTAIALTMLGAAGAAQAQEASGSAGAASSSPFSFSGTAAITNDYVFRGYSQTDSDPAFQAGLTASHESGFFVSAWGSNVDVGFDADIEVDLIAGYTNSVDNLTYTVGAYYYTYPGADGSADLDYFEAGLDLAYAIDKVTVTGKVYYSPEFYGVSTDAWYFAGGASVAVTDTISVYGAIGFNELGGGASYQDYQGGVAVKLEPFTVDLKYTDTDVKGAAPLGDGRFVATLTYAF